MNRFQKVASNFDHKNKHSKQNQAFFKWDDQIKRAGPTKSSPDDIVICGSVRTPLTKAKRGGFKDTRTEELLFPLFTALIEQTGLKVNDIEDICIGNVLQSSNALCARISQFLAGLPPSIPIYTVNRLCSSGLQAIANIAAAIQSNIIELGIAGGVESMTDYSMEDSLNPENISTNVFDNELARSCLTPMGVVSEIFTEKMNISRKSLDCIAVDSQIKASNANRLGLFKKEIIPISTKIKDQNGNEKKIIISEDDGIRPNTTLESLKKLKSPFKNGGSSHAGNSSQMTDGAALSILAKRYKAEQLNLPIIAKFIGFNCIANEPEMMPAAPSLVIPKVLAQTNLTMGDIDIFEVNEAFASVIYYTQKKLNIPSEKLNPKGGAIAIGHPLGCTGARQLATLLPELERTKGRYGIVSMCVGTGMGAAAVFENLRL